MFPSEAEQLFLDVRYIDWWYSIHATVTSRYGCMGLWDHEHFSLEGRLRMLIAYSWTYLLHRVDVHQFYNVCSKVKWICTATIVNTPLMCYCFPYLGAHLFLLFFFLFFAVERLQLSSHGGAMNYSICSYRSTIRHSCMLLLLVTSPDSRAWGNFFFHISLEIWRQQPLQFVFWPVLFGCDVVASRCFVL